MDGLPVSGISAGRRIISSFKSLTIQKSLTPLSKWRQEPSSQGNAAVEVEARAVKSGHYIGVDLDIQGHVTVACDRCLEDLQLPVEAHPAFSVKFGEEASSEEEMREGSREILFLSASDAELDLSQAIYDYVCLSLPMQRVHAEGECNPDTVRFLGQEPVNEEAGETNSPFAALKGLFDGK